MPVSLGAGRGVARLNGLDATSSRPVGGSGARAPPVPRHRRPSYGRAPFGDGTTMKAARFPSRGAPLELVDVPKPSPGAGQVLLRVQACGVCHSDLGVQAGGMPGAAFPRIPGHEVVGVIEEVGDGALRWNRVDRVGIGWHGWHDGTCPTCQRGDTFACPQQKITGLAFDGGYAEFMVAPVEG